MRVPTPPPSTESECGGNCTKKAHICNNSSGMPNERVQRRACDTSSSGSAIEPASKKNCAGRASQTKRRRKKVNVTKQKRKSSNGKGNKMSRRMKKWVESCLPVPDPMTFAIPAASKQRRSACLAKRQVRTGRYRAKERQKESKAAARLAMNKKRSKLRANEKEVLEGMGNESEKES